MKRKREERDGVNQGTLLWYEQNKYEMKKYKQMYEIVKKETVSCQAK